MAYTRGFKLARMGVLIKSWRNLFKTTTGRTESWRQALRIDEDKLSEDGTCGET